MGIINVLDFQVANLIAAGEVVERPASAVKELVENSIDAGADKITVEIKNGGSSLIRVSDNGKGIFREDVPVAVKRHATSKIRTAADLDGIKTLGFRGEALAAISSVSRLRIITKTAAEEVGTLFECYAGEEGSVSDTGAPVGTTVIVEELFANVPARRKFLKRDATEAMAVYSTLEKMAISHPEVALKFISDSNVKFETVGDGSLKNTLYALFGGEFIKKLTPVNSETREVTVTGFIGNPDNIRANRNFENFFINGRYVRCRTAQAALEQAYDSYIPKDKFPVCILNIKLSPTLVDVNVHPAKLEVKFGDERPVFQAVYSCARGTLENSLPRPELVLPETDRRAEEGRRLLSAYTPVAERGERTRSENLTFGMNAPKNEKNDVPFVFRPDIEYTPIEKTEEKKAPRESDGVSPYVSSRTRETLVSYVEAEKAEEAKQSPVPPENETRETESATSPISEISREEAKTENAVPFYRIIGEAFYTYVFVELTDRVLVIDKHAAHERMNFEELKRNLRSEETPSQLLLVPAFVSLSPEEIAAVREYEREIRATGFDFEIDMRARRVNVSAIPIGFGKESAEDAFATIADRLATGSGSAGETRDMIYEKALYQASCKAAVKGGEENDPKYVRVIVERLLTDPEIRYCPHGRPVSFEITKDNFDRQFKRK